VWLHIGEDGQVTGYTGKVEVGQGNRTSLTQAIAEELPVPLESIQLVMGDSDLSPFDFGTVGSRTSGVVAPQMRKVAAAAREIVLDLATEQTNLERTSLRMQGGKLRPLQNRARDSFSRNRPWPEMLKAVGEEILTKPATEWQVEATAVSKVNGRAFVTGKHHYTSDLKRPGMLYGRVRRPPAMNARRVSLDTSGAEAMPGVTLVCEENFIGVAAPDELCATRAIEAIQVEWKVAEGQPSSDEVFDYFRKHPSEIPGYGGPTAHIEGSVEEGLAAASRVLESSYTSAYIAHAPLEPRAAVAEWSAEEGKPRLTVWTGTQRPFGVRGELAETFGLSEDYIRVIVPDTGSGYGGKHTGDAAVEAARLARAAGKPVKLVWTREEEFAWAYFRPAGAIDIRSGVNDDGTITAWEYHNYNAGAAGMRTLYDIPHQHIEFHSVQSPLRQGSYRALAATANHFARETHMDELAHVMGMEPLAFRLKNLQDERLRAVLQAAAERFGWGKVRPSPDYGFGIAGGHEKGSYVATCAEVFVEPKSGE
jgi:isoquinoline 1-oxidoreductase